MKCKACGNKRDDAFKRLDLKVEVDILETSTVDILAYDRGRTIHMDLFLCTKCGTVRGE